MATVTTKLCDVFGQKSAERYRIIVTRIDDEGEVITEGFVSTEKDLCERAYKRLMGFVQRGLSKPGKEEVEEVAAPKAKK